MLVYRATYAERRALLYFCGKTRTDASGVKHLLAMVRDRRHRELYIKKKVPKSNGGTRVQFAPCEGLKEVQRGILNYLIRPAYPRHSASHGFRGKGRTSVAHAHAIDSTLLSLDVRDAFWQVSTGKLGQALIPEHHSTCGCFHCRKRVKQPGWSPYSQHVRQFIVELCTCITEDYRSLGPWPWIRDGFLPQGAPTSPALFELAFWDVDERLRKKAENLGAVYSRYADNLFFSLPAAEEMGDKLIRAIMFSVIERGFPVHKIKVKKPGTLRRVLGLNVENQRVFSPKVHRAKIRKAAHHLRWCLNGNRGELEKPWSRYCGLVAASVFEELPIALQREYHDLHDLVTERR